MRPFCEIRFLSIFAAPDTTSLRHPRLRGTLWLIEIPLGAGLATVPPAKTSEISHFRKSVVLGPFGLGISPIAIFLGALSIRTNRMYPRFFARDQKQKYHFNDPLYAAASADADGDAVAAAAAIGNSFSRLRRANM